MRPARSSRPGAPSKRFSRSNPGTVRPKSYTATSSSLSAEPDAVGALKGLARGLVASEDAAGALPYFERLRGLLPNDAEIHLEYAVALDRAGHADASISAFEECSAYDEAISKRARVHLDRLAGGTSTERLPEHFLRSEFDDFAAGFEHQLVDVLKYDVPDHMAAIHARLYSDLADKPNLLDLGCGTGLCSVAFEAHAAAMDGIDLSPKMLARARERGLYRHLFLGEVGNLLEQFQGVGYDLAVAADVFVYVGNPGPWFAALSSVLKTGGHFLFSFETGEAADYQLADTLRYRQRPKFLVRTAEAHGFEIVSAADCVLRQEAGRPVPGQIIAARLSSTGN